MQQQQQQQQQRQHPPLPTMLHQLSMDSQFSIDSPPSPNTTTSSPNTHTPSPTQDGDLSPLQDQDQLRRQRTAIACDFCIVRKIRCSGNQPVCDQCTRRGRVCMYSRQPRRRPGNLRGSGSGQSGRRDEMREMRERLRRLEAQLREQQDAEDSVDAVPEKEEDCANLTAAMGHTDRLSRAWDEAFLFPSPESSTNSTTSTDLVPNPNDPIWASAAMPIMGDSMSSTQPNPSNAWLPADDMSALFPLFPIFTTSPDPTTNWLDPPISYSTATTSSIVTNFMDSEPDPLPPLPLGPTPSPLLPVSSPTLRNLTPFDDLPPLPSPQISSELLRLYFQRVHPIFPALHRPTFQPSTTPPLLLLAMQAAASRFLPRSTTTLHYSSALFGRAKRLITPYLANADLPDMSIVMSLLCLILYASTSIRKRHADLAAHWSFSLVLLARRLRLSEELESEVVTKKTSLGSGASGFVVDAPHPPRDTPIPAWIHPEFRRRVWWCAYQVDAIMAISANVLPVVGPTESRVRLPVALEIWERPITAGRLNTNGSSQVSMSESHDTITPCGPMPLYSTLLDPSSFPGWSARVIGLFRLLRLSHTWRSDCTFYGTDSMPNRLAEREKIETLLNRWMDSERAGPPLKEYPFGERGAWRIILWYLSWIILHLPRMETERSVGLMASRLATPQDLAVIQEWVTTPSFRVCIEKACGMARVIEKVMESGANGEVDFGLAFVNFAMLFVGLVHLVAIRRMSWDPSDEIRTEAHTAFRAARTHLRALRASTGLRRDLADYARLYEKLLAEALGSVGAEVKELGIVGVVAPGTVREGGKPSYVGFGGWVYVDP